MSKTLSWLKLTKEERHIASSLSVAEVYEVSKLDDELERRRLIGQFTEKQVTVTGVRSRRSTKNTDVRTTKKRTVDGLEIRLASSVKFSNDELAKRLEKFADSLRRSRRSSTA